MSNEATLGALWRSEQNEKGRRAALIKLNEATRSENAFLNNAYLQERLECERLQVKAGIEAELDEAFANIGERRDD
jgi:hypothetical protein